MFGVVNLRRLTFFILNDSSSSLSTARMFSMGMLHRAPSPGRKGKNMIFLKKKSRIVFSLLRTVRFPSPLVLW